MRIRKGDIIKTNITFHQEDFDNFANLSGDDNPIHVDPAFSANSRFGRPVAHGMLLYGMLCSLLSHHYPYARQLEQEFIFRAPTFAQQQITIQAEVLEVRSDENQARLGLVMSNPYGDIVCDGQTLLWWPK